MLGEFPPHGERRRALRDVDARMIDLHNVLRIALVVVLGGLVWDSYKVVALVLGSPQTMMYQSARASLSPHAIVFLFTLAAGLPLPRMLAAVFWPAWRRNRITAKLAVFGTWFYAVGSMGLAHGSIKFHDQQVTGQFVGNGIFTLIGGFLVAVILNTDLKWEKRQ